VILLTILNRLCVACKFEPKAENEKFSNNNQDIGDRKRGSVYLGVKSVV